MTPLSIGTLWLSVNLTPGVLNLSGAKVSYQYLCVDRRGRWLGSFLYAVKVGVLNATNH